MCVSLQFVEIEAALYLDADGNGGPCLLPVVRDSISKFLVRFLKSVETDISPELDDIDRTLCLDKNSEHYPGKEVCGLLVPLFHVLGCVAKPSPGQRPSLSFFTLVYLSLQCWRDERSRYLERV